MVEYNEIHMTKNKESIIINGIPYSATQTIGDMVIAWKGNQQCKVFSKNSIGGKAVLYTIDGASIQEVLLPTNHEFVVLKTEKEVYVRDFNNQPIQDTTQWADYYFEPFTQHFYRKDERGNWYDIEGFRLEVPIFLKGQVLCSLLGKTSKKSFSFKQQELLISPNQQLIQVGKLVYNNQLELVQYFGEKITRIGSSSIVFGGQDTWQEVFLGLNRTLFINEFTHEPLLLHNEEIIQHVQTIKKGKLQYEVFKSASREYILEGQSNHIYSIEEVPVSIDWSTYLKIGKQHLALAKKDDNSLFIDIAAKRPFYIENIDTAILHIDPKPIRIGKELCYNVKTVGQSFVYNATQKNIFTLDQGIIQPTSIGEVKGFTKYFGVAIVNEQSLFFYKKHHTIIRVGKEEWTIQEILQTASHKLLNAIGTDGLPLVIDARKGLNQLALAHIEGQKIVTVVDQPFTIGNKILQNILMESLGGTVPRVINLNTEELSLFTLPVDLTENPEQATPSNFAGSPLTSIDFTHPIVIEGISFLKADFLSYLEQIHPIILQQKNGYPIQLDSIGHRMEVVSSFNEETCQEGYFLGEHRIIGTYTLTEELKEKELLFSITTLSNWLAFYDAYLPIFRRVVELKDTSTWEYNLFELRGVAKTTEYVAVEKNAPYRLFVENRRGTPFPKILKSSQKIKILKSPEDTLSIRTFFLMDPRYALVAVD